MPYNRLLPLALQEEQSRRVTTINEVNKLLTITQEWLNSIINQELTLENIKSQTISSLNYDIEMINKLNNYLTNNPEIKANATWPLKTNKNFELFNCAKNLLNEEFERIANNSLGEKYNFDPATKTMIGGFEGDVKGTSVLNCLQTGLFSILHSSKGINNITFLTELSENNIYNINLSPTIQTTQLPAAINHTTIDPQFKDWIYFYSDSLSPPQGELMYFTLGYSFGGSRDDERYWNKIFRTEDCSSAMAKWTNASLSFSTSHMEEVFDKDCHNSECAAVKAVMSPLSKELASVNPGDIFIFRVYDIQADPEKINRANSKGGHTGVVTAIYSEENCFETLSYSRNMPQVEGLGYLKDCINLHPERKYMFFSLNTNEPTNVIGDSVPLQEEL